MLVNVTVESRAVSDGEQECLTQEARGTWDAVGGGYRLAYEECFENEPPTQVVVTVASTQVVIERRGTCCSTMRFAPHTASVCPYRTPYGTLELTVFSEAVEIAMSESGGVLCLRYALRTAAGEDSQHTIQMTVSPLAD